MDFEEVLLEKMRTEARCPVCAAVEDLEYDHLVRLQYEVTESAAARSEVIAAGGFCDYHFRQFRKLASDRTNALLLQDMILAYQEQADQKKVVCIVCQESSTYESRLLHRLSRLIETEPFRTEYTNSVGLCLPHQGLVISDRSSRKLRAFVGEAQKKQLEALSKSLRKIISKSYQDTSVDERGAIPRAVEKVVGLRGIGF